MKHPIKGHYYRILNPYNNTYTVVQYKKQSIALKGYHTVYHLYSIEIRSKLHYKVNSVLNNIATMFNNETHLGTNYKAIKTMYSSTRPNNDIDLIKLFSPDYRLKSVYGTFISIGTPRDQSSFYHEYLKSLDKVSYSDKDSMVIIDSLGPSHNDTN